MNARTLKNLGLLVIPVLAILASCTLAPDHCITMSDCADGLTCNEGLCQGDPAGDPTLSADADTSSIGADGSTTSTALDAATPMSDAATVSDAADASDGAVTDATSD